MPRHKDGFARLRRGPCESRTMSRSFEAEHAVRMQHADLSKRRPARRSNNAKSPSQRALQAHRRAQFAGSWRLTGKPETILFLPGKSAFDKLPEWLQTNRYL